MNPANRSRVSITDHVLSFPRQLTSESDVRAAFRDAVQRLRGIFTDRILGMNQVVLTEQDKRLLAGDLDLLVPPGHTISLTAQPQVTFRPERLVIDDELAGSFDVSDVKVGRNSQLMSSSPLAGSLFKASATPVRLETATAQIAMNVTVTLTNTSGSAQPVPKVSMLGKIVWEREQPE